MQPTAADEPHPEVQAVLEEIDEVDILPLNQYGPAGAREVYSEMQPDVDGPEVGAVEDRTVPGYDGGPEVPVRVYRPDGEGPFPTVVFYHGGGFVIGDLESHDLTCRYLANETDSVVVAVDYRLAPEHPFPVAVDEAAAAVEWVAENATAFGGDPDRLGVSGTSAGAALAFAACLHRRELSDAPVAVAGQFLLYPIAGDDFETDSYRENADGPLLTRADMRWFFERYLRSPVDARNPFAVPLRADDLGDLPPATVVTAGFDPLREDGVALAERFEAEGTPVEHRHYPAMAHGFCSLADRVAVAETALSAVAGDVRERL